MLRDFFIRNTKPLLLVDFAGESVFEATGDVNILIFKKDRDDSRTSVSMSSCTMRKMGDGETFPEFIKRCSFKCSFEKGKDWSIMSDSEQSIREKVAKIGKPLGDPKWDIKINYGIKTGFNEAFIIDGEKRRELISQNPKSDEIIRPILRGRDISRYTYSFADKYIILAKFDSHKTMKNDHPAIYEHLLKYEFELKERGQCRYSRSEGGSKYDYPGQHHWLELDNNPRDNYLVNILWQN